MPVTNPAVARTGLCATCNNSTTCVYRSKRGFDALYCEMFDGYLPSIVSEANRGMEKTAESEEARTVKPVSSEHKGLCANCGNRETCALPRPEEGVWHCEEYC